MRILVSVSTGMGNLLLKLPLLQGLSKTGHELILLDHAEPWTAPILKMASLPEPITWPSKSKTDIFIPRRSIPNCDLALIPFDSTLKGLEWAIIGKAKKIVQHIPPRRGKNYKLLRLLADRSWLKVTEGCHETELNLELARSVGLMIPNSLQQKLSIPEFMQRTESPYLVVQPGAANGTLGAKVWAKKNFEIVINEFLEKNSNSKVVLVGDCGDLASLGDTVRVWEGSNKILNLMGKTTIPELASIINKARLVLCHDSGVMHLANALGTQLIALYGPTDDSRTAPLSSTSHILYSSHNSRGAMKGFKYSEQELSRMYPQNECLSSITPQDVLAKINQLWNV